METSNKRFLLREFYGLSDVSNEINIELTDQQKAKKSSGTMFLQGVMQRADALNGNGRVYPAHILQREIKNYEKIVNDNRALGECDHPETPIINLANTSHIVRKIWWDGQDVKGVIEILNTPSGKVIKELISSGVKLGISSRGMGSVNEAQNGQIIVEEDFQLICFDMVSEPSTPGAFMLAEGKRFDSNKIFSKADRINRLLNEIV